jgi:hypothetical protein
MRYHVHTGWPTWHQQQAGARSAGQMIYSTRLEADTYAREYQTRYPNELCFVEAVPDRPQATLQEAIRKLYPHARRKTVVGIVRNGAAVRVYSCIVCGSMESMCRYHRMPKRLAAWREEHETHCGRELIRRMGGGR